MAGADRVKARQAINGARSVLTPKGSRSPFWRRVGANRQLRWQWSRHDWGCV